MPLPQGANYCPECGGPVGAVLDPLGVGQRPAAAEPMTASAHPRLGIALGLLLFAGVVGLLWLLARGDGPEALPPTGDDEVTGPESTSSTMESTTSTTPRTTVTTTTVPEQMFVNDTPGPVLGEGVDGVIAVLGTRRLLRVDLTTAVIDEHDLDQTLRPEGDGRYALVGREVVAMSGEATLVLTDVLDGSQRIVGLPLDAAPAWGIHVAGPGGPGSVWLATYPGPDQMSLALEISLDGEILRAIELPQPFSVERAGDDLLLLWSPSGSFLWDLASGTVTPLAGDVTSDSLAVMVMTVCDSSLECRALIDRGRGPTEVQGLTAADVANGWAHVSPDGSRLLVHRYGERGVSFIHLDLETGIRTDLGEIDIEPYAGLVWVEGSPWVIGRGSPGRLNPWMAIDTRSGEIRELSMPAGTNVGYEAIMVMAPE